MHRFFSILLMVGMGLSFKGTTYADEPVLPGAGWPVSRYEALWTKSPFSVATPEGAQASPDYSLWGIAQFDGVSYASMTDKKSDDHFLLSTDKPVRGMRLVSVTRGNDPSSTVAVVERDGQMLTFKLETVAAPPAGAPNPGAAAANTGPGGGPSPTAGEPAPAGGMPPPQNASNGMPVGFSRYPGAGPQAPMVTRRTPTVHVPSDAPTVPGQPPPPTP